MRTQQQQTRPLPETSHTNRMRTQQRYQQHGEKNIFECHEALHV